MLDESATYNDHTALAGAKCQVVDLFDILHDVHNKSRMVDRVRVQTVAYCAVRDGRAEHWDVVLVAPVVDTLFGVDSLAKPADDFRGREDFLALFLLFMHCLDNRLEEGFELYVARVRDK